MSSVFEMLMLILFGVSWPISIAKSYKSKSTNGQSIWFLLVVALGYVCGIMAKLCSGQVNYVIAFYICNLLMVLVNIAIYRRNFLFEQRWHPKGALK